MADQPNNVKEYVDLESLIFANKMIENQERFCTADTEKIAELRRRKAVNLTKMKTIIKTLEAKGELSKEPVPYLGG